MARKLTALLNGRLVGEIDMAHSGAITFRYAQDWLVSGRRCRIRSGVHDRCVSGLVG